MSHASVRPRRVLPTLNADGTRRWIRPRQFEGRYLRARRGVGWALIALFAALPFMRIGGQPAILLDVPARQFYLFGATLRATDGVLLMLLLLSVAVGIFALTAWIGRAWCGWACPQTVYMELLFRPLERWLEGGRSAQLKLDRDGPNLRRVLRHGVFALLAIALGNLFLSYFVGVQRLATWMTSSPLEHPAGFLSVVVTSLLVFADFGFFREQMCTVACPYARLQSVLLDPRSIVVGYDRQRGEPRGRGAGHGDCVDCGACVASCPTGIDIRNGLQLECVTCAQCIDACDSVMTKFHLPRGLIRYDQSHALQGVATSLRPLRSRLGVYLLLLAGLLGGLVYFGRAASEPEITLLRGSNLPFRVHGQQVENQLRIKIQNRSRGDGIYHIQLLSPAEATLIVPDGPLHVAAGARGEASVRVLLPRQALGAGSRSILLAVTDDGGFARQLPYRMLGPSQAGS